MSNVFDELLKKCGIDPEEPTPQERMEAQVLYTALMTDTLIEEGDSNV